MTAANLAVVFAPNLLWNAAGDGTSSVEEAAGDNPVMTKLLNIMITDYDLMFARVEAPSLCVLSLLRRPHFATADPVACPPYGDRPIVELASPVEATAATVPERKRPRRAFFDAIASGEIDAAAQLLSKMEIVISYCVDDDGNTGLMHAVTLRYVERMGALAVR